SIALVGPLGIEGVAIGTLVPHVAFCLFALAHLGGRVGVTPGEYVRSAGAAPLAATSPAVAVWLALTHLAPPASWGVLVGEGLLGLLPAALAALAIDGRPLVARLIKVPPGRSPRSRPPMRAAG